MDPLTRERAHSKLSSIKEYIGYPEEILDDSKLEELYSGLEMRPGRYFDNGITLSVWTVDYYWKKLREKVHRFLLCRVCISIFLFFRGGKKSSFHVCTSGENFL